MPYLLSLSIDKTLTTSPIVLNYIRFPQYKGTSYLCWKMYPKEQIPVRNNEHKTFHQVLNTVKIRDSALGLSGFVSFFGGRICRGGAYPRRIYSYALWANFNKLTFLGGPICGGSIYGRRYGGFLRYISSPFSSSYLHLHFIIGNMYFDFIQTRWSRNFPICDV